MNYNFCVNLKNLRLDNDLSQIKLSEKLGISRSTYSNYENGISEPDLDMIIKISDFFNCSIDELLKGKVATESYPFDTPKFADPTFNFDINKFNIEKLLRKLKNNKKYYENHLKQLNKEIKLKIKEIDEIVEILEHKQRKNHRNNKIEFAEEITPIINKKFF
ncbi:helix-turn-helix transcriptional regulator [Clostridium sardiniense]|uniref:Helix-turn-helix transcriptional regulator n=1 Tax=Clostridium sardiniense TaxID=29369 RepID=A0ABS7KT00_CLOSR|nr:helix-turn-helix transcriptional regulator [Clostridium sardiniense]MBY0753945.1 helix-turn-helix transcriptional regulator [Clostridium sardiniense]MDQ0459539.1 transcriptional regulator with XRE-family HTH domain [Clostridium sardiniense]